MQFASYIDFIFEQFADLQTSKYTVTLQGTTAHHHEQ